MRGNRPLFATKAFTLIELLVVIAVLVVLMGILLPTLGKAREVARSAKCGTNLKQWGLGIQTFANNNTDFLPSKGGDGSASNPVGNWSDPNLWFNAIPSQFAGGLGYNDLQKLSKPIKSDGPALPWGGKTSIFVCPSANDAQGVGQGANPGPPDTIAPPYFLQYGFTPVAPAGNGEARRTFICYNWNSKMVHGDPNVPDNNTVQLKIAAVSNSCVPSTVITMSEKRMRQDELDPNDSLNPVAAMDRNYNNYYKTLVQFKGMWSRFTTRHSQGGNVLFLDGHVSLMKYHELNTPSLYPTGNSGDWNHLGNWVWDPLFPAN